MKGVMAVGPCTTHHGSKDSHFLSCSHQRGRTCISSLHDYTHNSHPKREGGKGQQGHDDDDDVMMTSQ